MKKYYFQVVSIIILLLSVVGFSDNLFTDPGQKSNSDPKFVIHGLMWFAWMIVFVVQSSYIRKNNYTAHKRLGILSMFLAIGVVLSTLYIFIATYPGWSNLAFFAKANRFFMASFAVLIYLGYRYRFNAERHKRLIYLATLLILEPILSRAVGNFGSTDLIIALIWNGLFLSFFAYDWMTLRRIHPITYLGFIWFYFVWTVAIAFS